MSTELPSTTSAQKTRLRGDMYLRAEERHRAEVAAAQVAAAMTAPAGPPVYQPTARDISPAQPDVTRIETIAAPTVVAQPAPAGTVIAPKTTVTPRLAPAVRSHQRRFTLMPAAALATLAVLAMFGIALTLSPGDEPASAAPVRADAAAAPASPPMPGTRVEEPRSVDASTPIAEPPATIKAPVAVVARTARETTAPRAAAPVTSVTRALDGRLRITSTPAGARVTVDGIGWGQTPVTVGHLPFGRKTVRLTRDGYQAQQAIVSLSGDRPEQAVSVVMTRR